jgi:hypothetical protein
MNQERNLLIVRLELIGDDYEGISSYIKTRLEKTGHKHLRDLSAIELVNLYDSVLCKIYQ